MEAKVKKALRKQFAGTPREGLATIKAEAEAVVAADPNRQDAKDVIEVVTELLADNDSPSYEEVVAENEALKARVAELEGAQQRNAETEKAIREKMVHGLTREQAISVIKRQAEHDARKAEEAAKAKEAKEAAKAK